MGIGRGRDRGCLPDSVPPLHVPPRTVVMLQAEDWRYGNVPHGPVALCVERVRWELAELYDGEVWADGYVVDCAGVPLGWAELLVRIDALRREMSSTGEPENARKS